MKTSIEELEKNVKDVEYDFYIKEMKEYLITCILQEDDRVKLEKIANVIKDMYPIRTEVCLKKANPPFRDPNETNGDKKV